MRELARRDRQRWQGLTRDQRVAEAMAKAMEDIKAEAALTEYRAGLQVLRTAETDSRVAEQMRLTGLTRSQGLIRDIENTSDYVHAVRNEAISGLADMIDAAESRDGTGALRNLGMRIFDLDNPQMTADVVREVFANADGSTGNKVAQAGAKAWLDVIEKMRQRFNAAGGAIGKLGYGYLSQAHDAVRVLEAGAATWAKKVLPLLDREQYVRPDGSLMNDAELTDLLRGAWETISTGGDSKTEPGQYRGSGSRANRGSDHRVLHFRDGDAWMAYMTEYGEGSLYDSMVGHVGRMARDIGLVERYGPNPEQQFRVQSDIAQRADGVGTMGNRSAGNTPDAYWSILSGKTGTPENRVVAQIGQDARNIQTAAKLGGAVLSSTTDVATVAASLHYNRLPYFSMLANLGRQFSREQRDFLQAHGVIGEALTSTLNRWTGDHMTHSLTGRVAGSVMKLSLMNAWTDGLRGAFAATMMQGFAKKLGTAWSSLSEWDRYLMQRKGITEADWSIITKAAPTDRNGQGYLTHDAIRGVTDMTTAKARVESVQQLETRLTTEAAAATAHAAQLDAELPNVLAALKGNADEVELTKREKARVSAAKANATRLTGAIPDAVSDYAGRYDDLVSAVHDDLTSQAATKWLAFVSDEAQFAVVNPDLATRAIVTGGGMPAGTVRGEAMRSFMQFKSFPLAMLTRHWRRVFETPQGLDGAPMGYGATSSTGAAVNRVAVLAAINVTLMTIGALVMQNKALVQGKDPYDMTEGKFWMRAMAQGGGAGYVGDLLFKDPTEQRGSNVEQGVGAILGPAAGAAAGLVGDLGVVNAWEAAKGKETHIAAEALRWGNSQMPYVSLWQVRGAWEHWFLHNAQEAVNPGYLSRMQQRSMKDWGQGYWWTPGEALPDRAPDFERAVGQ